MISYVPVLQFYDALGTAIHDRVIEDAGEELRFFYDADVTVDMVIGLTSWSGHALPSLSELSTSLVYAVRALMSTGFLPTARFLRPHLAEIKEKFETLPDSPKLEGFHETAMQRLKHEWGLAEYEIDLRNRLKDDHARGFYEFIQEHGYSVFVKLELCLGGTWSQRLRRLLRADLFRFSEEGSHELPRPDDAVAAAFAEQLSILRSDPNRAFNNQLDAYALAELSRKRTRGVHARFYTETKAVRTLFRRLPPSLLESLCEDGLPVLRSEEYFLIRSSFSALAFTAPAHGVRSAHVMSEYYTMETLKKIHADLHRVLFTVDLNADDPSLGPTVHRPAPEVDIALDRALREIPAGNGNLGDLIERFYSLGFLESVFLSWSPAGMERWFPPLFEAKKEPEVVGDARRKLTYSLDGLFEELDREIGQMKTWRSTFLEIMHAVHLRFDNSRGIRPRLNVEFGLGRWGLDEKLEPEVVRRLENALRALQDEDTRETTAASLGVSFAFPTPDLNEFSFDVCLMWCLGLDDLIRRRFRELADALRSQVPPWLELLRLIAEVRTAAERHSQGDSLHTFVAEVVEQTRILVRPSITSHWNEGYAEMGLAHVTYWAWKSLGADTKGSGKIYAEESFLAAERAQAWLPTGTLGWAFAVNHCAYMGFRAHIHRSRTEAALEKVDDAIPKRWSHYRFTDTQVRASTESIVRDIRKYKIGKLKRNPAYSDIRKRICVQLQTALKRLQEQPYWGDMEVQQHVNMIERRLNEIGCHDC